MKSDAAASVVIVGGGFSGVMAGIEIARRGISVVLLEGAGRAGRGVAYSTREPAHLLNVPAARMSAFADAPDHFVKAVASEGYHAQDFVPRARYGQYLGELLDEALGGGAIALVEQVAVAARRSSAGWTVTLGDGRSIEAAALVLAGGNQPPEPMRCAAGISAERFVNNPWSAEAGSAIAELARDGGDALVIGTGLTMVDLMLSLDEAGHRGRIVALSRRGLVPRAHAAVEPAPVALDAIPHGEVVGLLRWLRKRSSTVGWRSAVDALRPYSQALWQALDQDQRRRFLRHARPWYDVHRHRIAPQVAQRLQRLVGEGRLEIVAGRIGAMDEREGGLIVEIKRRGGAEMVAERFAVGFNCTGPLGAIGRTRDALLMQMLGDALIAPDALGIALEVDDRSRAGAGVWALGPLTKERFWEVVAVPDIRGQVAKVADDIAKELRR